MQHAPIVVGIEDTDAAAEALRWAAWESQRTQVPLVVVHAYESEPTEGGPCGLAATRESVARSWATHWVRDALSECAALPWRTHLVVAPESPGAALVRLSEEAALLVLGNRAGRGSPSPLAALCERSATCPVVLVPPPDAPPSGPANGESSAHAPAGA
jgi:nucleotide-binding universal stress UspA family protein